MAGKCFRYFPDFLNWGDSFFLIHGHTKNILEGPHDTKETHNDEDNNHHNLNNVSHNCTFNSQQPTTNNPRPTTDSRQPTANNQQQPTTNNNVGWPSCRGCGGSIAIIPSLRGWGVRQCASGRTALTDGGPFQGRLMKPRASPCRLGGRVIESAYMRCGQGRQGGSEVGWNVLPLEWRSVRRGTG